MRETFWCNRARVLDATALAVLASVGKWPSRSFRPSRASFIITTGDEIVPPDTTPGPGQIRNSNAFADCRPGSRAGRRHESRTTTSPTISRKCPGRICLKREPENFDVILISGGSGPAGLTISAWNFSWRSNATIHFRAVNVRPGKPLIFGTSWYAGAGLSSDCPAMLPFPLRLLSAFCPACAGPPARSRPSHRDD